VKNWTTGWLGAIAFVLLACSGCEELLRPRGANPQARVITPLDSPAAAAAASPESHPAPAPSPSTESPKQQPLPPPVPAPIIIEKPPEIQRPKINLEAERKNLLEADALFSRASEEHGAADAFFEHMTPDALLLLPGEVPIKGTDAIKVHLTVNRPGLFIWRARDAKVAESADLGYSWGTYELRSYNLDTRNPPIRYGKYLMVWRKQAYGLWKASVVSASPSPPPTERR